MATLTKSKTEVVEAVLTGSGYPGLMIGLNTGHTFSAWAYYPSGDVVKDVGCYGNGKTIAEALRDLAKKWEAAAAVGRKIKTAADCKAAVIELIEQHDAAPPEFREAVHALNVSRY